jgi:arabinogalactan endo-1,4-beta-galactosidase
MKIPSLLLVQKNLPSLLLLLLLIFQSQEVKAQFANGADIGWLSQMEYQRFVFKDSTGVQKDCLDILKEKGINSLRFRVWVNPSGGYCNKKDVAYMAKRADSKGFKVMLDFHLSDSWADPGHQNKPAAWATHTISQLTTDVANHITDILDTLKAEGVTPAWVQIGNETNDGTLWEDCRATKNMSNFAAIIKSGYDAVKAIDTSIQVIVHLSDGNNNTMYRWMFDGLKSNGAKWDIIGMSVYPYWANLTWQKDDSLALINMKDMISRYQTKIMVCEAGYLFNQPVEANHYLIDLISKTKSVGGLGVFYWEPESNPQEFPSSGYNLGAWDPVTNQPTVALDAFRGNYVTVVADENENKNSNYSLNIYPDPFNPSTAINFSIPKSSIILITIYDILGREVTRLFDGFKSAGNYNLKWTANNVSSGIYFCRLQAGDFIITKKIVLQK